MSELDVLLRESLGRLAEPGDPTGVVEAIRARVEAAGSSGDGGDGASGAGGSGEGGSGGGTFWSGPGPFAILIGLSLAGGAALGLGGALGRPDAPPQPPVGAAAGIVTGGAQALGCPGGAPIETLPPGTRVLAMERSEDGDFVSVRDPYALAKTVWLPTGVLVPDEGAGAYGDLPVGGCAVASPLPSPTPSPSPSPSPSAVPTPAPDPGQAPKPTDKPTPPPPPPAPAPDTQAPTVQVGTWSDSTLHGADQSPYCSDSTATISLSVGDNVGVTNVAASSNYPGATASLQSHSGSTWTFIAQMPNQPLLFTGSNVTYTFTATDAAGNATQVTATLYFEYCLI